MQWLYVLRLLEIYSYGVSYENRETVERKRKENEWSMEETRIFRRYA